MTLRCLSILLLLLPFSFVALAQTNKEATTKTFVIDSSVVHLDSLPIYPKTFSLNGLENHQYQIDFLNSVLYVNKIHIGKQILVSYQTFAFDFTKSFSNKSKEEIITKGKVYQPPKVNYDQFLEEESSSNLTSTGSIARGFSIGNNQDFVLNSSLNLQLSGYLTKDLKIEANITDKNVPIQPEGNTRVIQDFDKIFIHLNYKNQFRLLAGDIDVVKPEGYFLVLDKKILGMELIADNRVGKHFNVHNRVGGGISRGKFIRKKLEISNGMQGPYKLTSDVGSQNIVILSGTERVYVDNQLLTRGDDEDYVIDYNTGEITFTAKVMVTSEKEINIEYQYTDLSYSRFTLYSFNTFQHQEAPKWKVNFNVFYEQDLRNNSIQPELDDDMKLFLSQLGNEMEGLYPNVDTSSFYPNEVLYIKKDTIDNGFNYSIYEYTTLRDEQLYRLNFTYIGPNRGNYQLSTQTANGRVFVWVAPINGVPQGDYEPVILLTTPKSTFMATVGSAYQFLKNTSISAEGAISHNNINLFAPKNEAGQLGGAAKINFEHKNPLGKKEWWFATSLDYELLSRNFQPIESFRSIEFYKDYNLTTDYSNLSTENMAQWQMIFSHKEIGEVSFAINYYDRGALLRALRNEVSSEIQKNGWKLSTQNSLLFSNDSLYNTNYVRTFNKLSKTFKKIEIGLYERFERNLFTSNTLDSIMPNSFLMNESYIYIKNNDSLNTKYHFFIKNIINQVPIEGLLTTQTIANEASFTLEFSQLKNNNFKLISTYRNELRKENLIQEGLNEHFFVGNIVYSGRFFKNAIALTTNYEAGSGLEQKKSYSFIKVGAGQGTHIWNDYNGNGIEELEEFEIAAFQHEANYMKVWLPTQEFYNVFSNQFSQFIYLRPSNLWGNTTGIKKFIARFSNSTSLRIQQKNSNTNIAKALNPFVFNYQDSTIQNANLQLNNTFAFNQLSQLWGAEYTYKLNESKDILYYGEEYSNEQSHFFQVRVQPVKLLTIKTNYQFGENERESYFAIHSYNLKEHLAKLLFNMQYNNKMYWNLSYNYSSKVNIANIEKMQRHDAVIDFSYKWVNIGNIVAKLNYAHIRYNGEENSSLSYTMLDGLQDGHNLIWGVTFQTRITEYLQIDLSYDGRAAQKNRAVHTALLQIKAIF